MYVAATLLAAAVSVSAHRGCGGGEIGARNIGMGKSHMTRDYNPDTLGESPAPRVTDRVARPVPMLILQMSRLSALPTTTPRLPPPSPSSPPTGAPPLSFPATLRLSSSSRPSTPPSPRRLATSPSRSAPRVTSLPTSTTTLPTPTAGGPRPGALSPRTRPFPPTSALSPSPTRGALASTTDPTARTTLSTTSWPRRSRRLPCSSLAPTL